MTDGPHVTPRTYPEGIFPAFFESNEIIDLSSDLALAQSNLDTDLPESYLQDLAEEVASWHTRQTEGETTEDILPDVRACLADGEADYPRALVWNGVRLSAAKVCVDIGNHYAAFQLLNEIDSAEVMVGGLERLAQHVHNNGRDGEAFIATFSDMLERNSQHQGGYRYLGFLRARANYLITYDPDSNEINRAEAELVKRVPGSDAISTWADSLAAKNAINGGLKHLAAELTNEEKWLGVPFNMRRFGAQSLYGLGMELQLADDDSDLRIMHTALNVLYGMENAYPDASVWNDKRLGLAKLAIFKGWPAHGREFGLAMTSADHQEELIHILDARGYSDESMAIALGMYDSKKMPSCCSTTSTGATKASPGWRKLWRTLAAPTRSTNRLPVWKLLVTAT